jgi:SAM-dependent methyltransferase
VDGIDASAAMIEQARLVNSEVEYRVATAQTFCQSGSRDVISMLFHVMSYQVADDDVRRALSNIAGHLSPEGLVLFDFWHSDAFRDDPPARRIREANVAGRPMFRVSVPGDVGPDGSLSVRFEFRQGTSHGPVVHQETHLLQGRTEEAFEAFVREAGLEPLACEGWMTRQPLKPSDWYGLMIARRPVAI